MIFKLKMGLKDICKNLFVDLVKSCHPQIQRGRGGGIRGSDVELLGLGGGSDEEEDREQLER